MKSMTGYASCEKHTPLKQLAIEIKTLNNRYLDCKFKSPSDFMYFEPRVIKEVKKIFSRGTIEVFLFEKKMPVLDKDFSEYCFKNLKSLRKKFFLKGDIQINHLLSLMNMWSFASAKGIKKETEEQKWKMIESLLSPCLKKVEQMRIKEGEALKKSILNDLHQFEGVIKNLTHLRKSLALSYEAKLREKIAKFLKDTTLDESRLHQEIAYLIERSDISEELTRLQSHVKQFQGFSNKEGSIGKSLDFLIQEMNREINTIGSKIQDIEISQKVIVCKTLLEKIREQVQNVE